MGQDGQWQHNTEAAKVLYLLCYIPILDPRRSKIKEERNNKANWLKLDATIWVNPEVDLRSPISISAAQVRIISTMEAHHFR